MGEKLETWSVGAETIGAARLTRWARVWRSDALGYEETGALHKRFGGAPLMAASLQVEPAKEVAYAVPA